MVNQDQMDAFGGTQIVPAVLGFSFAFIKGEYPGVQLLRSWVR